MSYKDFQQKVYSYHEIFLSLGNFELHPKSFVSNFWGAVQKPWGLFRINLKKVFNLLPVQKA